MPTAIRRLVAFYGLHLRLVRTWRLGRASLLRHLVLANLVAFIALAITVWLVPGISVSTDVSLVLAVLAIALLNAGVRPIVLALTVPFGVLAVASVGVILQVGVVIAVGAVVPGLHVRDLTAAIEGAVLFSIFNAAVSWFIALGEDQSYFGHLARLLIREQAGAPRSEAPGAVFVQIDGLSHPTLLHEVRAGRLPTISRWLRSGTHRLDEWRCQLPSQTSASQAGLLLGSNDGIPAFRWYEKATNRLMVSNRAPDAAEIERRLSTGRGLLADGGTSIGNLLSGDATESILTMSRLGDRIGALGPTRSWFYFLVSPFSFARALSLTVGEALKEIWQAHRQSAAGIEPRIDRGGIYPVLRAVTNVFLRQLSTSLVVERILRGTPVVYVDFVDYDEIAHHAGPERGEALDALDGIDQVLATFERVAADAPRPYRFVVLSDHGQSLGATFRQRYGTTVEGVIRGLIGEGPTIDTSTSPVEAWGPVNALASEVSGTNGVGGRVAGRMFRRRQRDGYVELGPVAAGGDELPELVVCASGNLALVYLNRVPGRMTLEEIDEAYPGLVQGLGRHSGIGFVLVRSARFGGLALGAGGCHYLADDRVEGLDPLLPFGPGAADDLRRLDGMAVVGDLVLNSRLDPDTNEVAAFEELVGSHGGLGGPQTDAFIVHPSDWSMPEGRVVGAPGMFRVLAGWLEAAGMRSRDEPSGDKPSGDKPSGDEPSGGDRSRDEPSGADRSRNEPSLRAG